MCLAAGQGRGRAAAGAAWGCAHTPHRFCLVSEIRTGVRQGADQGVWPDLPLSLLESAEWGKLCPVLTISTTVTPKISWPLAPDQQEVDSGVHPLSHQGRIKCLSCLAARLIPSLARAEGHRASAQWALILQGGQGMLFPWAGLLLSWVSEPLDVKSCSERLVPSVLVVSGQGDSAVTHIVPGSIGSTGQVSGHLGGGFHCVSQCIQVIPIAGHPGPRCSHPVSKDVASAGDDAGAGDELAHARSPAQKGPAWHTRFQQRFITGSLHGPSSLPGMEQGIPFREWRGGAWPRQNGRAR